MISYYEEKHKEQQKAKRIKVLSLLMNYPA